MAKYIDCDAFIAEKRMHYCAACKRRQGMKNGKMQFCYEIGDAPCRACDVADMLDYIEDFPTADVAPVRHGKWNPFDLTWGHSIYACTVCEEAIDVPTRMGKPIYAYCPACGADMRELSNEP